MHARDLKQALDGLCHAGLVTKIHHTTANGLPLRTQINEKKFKLLLLDVGLMQSALQTPYNIESKEILGIHHGAVAEQFAGQELIALSDPYQDSRIHFWEREKKDHRQKLIMSVISGAVLFLWKLNRGQRAGFAR